MAQTGEVNFEIVKSLAVLSENEKSKWTKELNLVSWNGRDPKYDLRDWSPDHTKMGKGVTLTGLELTQLKESLGDIDIEDY